MNATFQASKLIKVLQKTCLNQQKKRWSQPSKASDTGITYNYTRYEIDMRFQLFHKIPQFDLDQLDPSRRKWNEMDVLLLSRRYLNNHNWVEYWDNVQQTWSGLQGNVQAPELAVSFGSLGQRLSGTRMIHGPQITHGIVSHGSKITGWWFGTFFVFHNIRDNPSH
jgi:hypothetical protein